MRHLETCFLIAEADGVLCRQLVMFLTVFFHWIYKMNLQLVCLLLVLIKKRRDYAEKETLDILHLFDPHYL